MAIGVILWKKSLDVSVGVHALVTIIIMNNF